MRRIAVLFMLFGVSECSGQCLLCFNASIYAETRASFDVTLPMSCPPNSSIYVEGASSIDSCTCDEGFVGSGGNCISNATETTSSSVNIPLVVGASVGGGVAAVAILTGLLRYCQFPAIPPVINPFGTSNMFLGVKITPGRIPR
jgi:hypothetical protein